MTIPVLALPSNDDQYVLDTDASGVGLGAVLSVVRAGMECPMAFASRLCSAAERNYNVTRRELLAVMFALKIFRQYLLGREFVIRTDHAALQWLKRTPTPIGQQARWVEQLEEFQYRIQHRPGDRHQNADAMSRRPTTSEDVDNDETRDIWTSRDVDGVVNMIRATAQDMTENEACFDNDHVDRADLAEQQRTDPDLREIYDLKTKHEQHPGADSVISLAAVTKSYVQQWDQIELRDGVLYRRWKGPFEGHSRNQILLPTCRRNELLKAAHSGFSGGHLGFRKTLAQVSRRAYWVGWTIAVQQFCRQCSTCATYYRGKAPKQAFNRCSKSENLWNGGALI